jgi:5-hydroxyisourate hydrolase-like protein (transthyretin family)
MLVEPEAGVRGEERFGHADEEGMFELIGLSPGLRVLRASHPAYPPTLLEAELEGGTTEVELSFEKGIAIFGRVLDGLGLPLADIPVRARRLEGHRHQVSTRTGPEGHFSLRPLAAGRYRLLVEPADRAFASRVVELSPDQEIDVEFRLAQGATITGVVRGLDPSAAVGLLVAARGVGVPRFAAVQRDGSYRIENLPVGKWALQIDVAGRLARDSVSIDLWEAEQGAEIWLDLDLGGGYTLSGVVRSRSEPLAGAWVSLGAGLFWARTQIAHDGTFRFEGLKTDSYTLRVRDFATGLRYQQLLTVEGDRDLTLDLMPTALGAMVRDAGTGIPLAGALVQLVRLTAAGEQTASQQRSDSLGNVNLGNVDGGSWQVVAQRPGYQTARVRVEPRGELRKEVELWLQRHESLK